MKEGDVLICKLDINYFIAGNKYVIYDVIDNRVYFTVNSTVVTLPINDILIFFEPLKEYRKRIILDLL